MSLACRLAFLFLLASLTFAQDQLPSQRSSETQPEKAGLMASVATRSNSGQTVSNQLRQGSKDSPLDQLSRGESTGFVTVPLRSTSNPSKFFVVPPKPATGSDDISCLNIRSYVVARDSKDSDSTHPVSSTTCVPASKYNVKVVEQRVVMPDASEKH
jgi:hypothetical protein